MADLGFKPDTDEAFDLGFVAETKELPTEDLGFVSESSKTKQKSKPKSRREKLEELKAGLAGAATGATLGFADEIMGGVTAAIDVAIDKTFRPFLSEEQTRYMETPEFKKVYKEERDKVREELRRLEKKNPKAFLTGEVVGGVATSALPGTLAAKAAGNLAKAIKLGTGAVGTGAAAGAGFSEEEQASEIAKDAAAGAFIGGMLGGAGAGISKAMKKIVKIADSSQIKKLGLSTEKINKMDPAKRRELINFARENKVITKNKEQSLNNALKLREDAAERIGLLHKSFQDKNIPLYNKEKLIKDLEEQVLKEYDAGDTPGTEELIRSIIERAKKLPENDFLAAQKLYSRVGQHTRQNTGFDQSASRFMFKVMSDNIDESLEQAGKQIKNPKLKEAYRQINKEYRFATNIAEAAEKAAGRPAPTSPLLTKGEAAVAARGGAKAAAASAALRHATNKLSPEAFTRLSEIIRKGGRLGERASELAEKGQIKKLSTLLLTEELHKEE